VKLTFCAACGSRDDLHRLITRGEASSDDERNLVTLCASCHAKLNKRQANSAPRRRRRNRACPRLRRAYAPDACPTRGSVGQCCSEGADAPGLNHGAWRPLVGGRGDRYPQAPGGRKRQARHPRPGDSLMSERILMKFIVGQRVIKQGEDSRFEGQSSPPSSSAT
jgi:hypothetical protein